MPRPLYSRETLQREFDRFCAIYASLPERDDRTAAEDNHARRLETQMGRLVQRMDDLDAEQERFDAFERSRP